MSKAFTGAEAYAASKGYEVGDDLSADDLGVNFVNHRGHGGVTYTGTNAGNLEFRCRCSDVIFVPPPGS